MKPKGLLNAKVSLGQPKTCNLPWGLCQALQDPEMLWHLLLAHGQVRVARCHVSAEPREATVRYREGSSFQGPHPALSRAGRTQQGYKALAESVSVGHK